MIPAGWRQEGHPSTKKLLCTDSPLLNTEHQSIFHSTSLIFYDNFGKCGRMLVILLLLNSGTNCQGFRDQLTTFPRVCGRATSRKISADDDDMRS